MWPNADRMWSENGPGVATVRSLMWSSECSHRTAPNLASDVAPDVTATVTPDGAYDVAPYVAFDVAPLCGFC